MLPKDILLEHLRRVQINQREYARRAALKIKSA
jgi:hypothetical protein